MLTRVIAEYILSNVDSSKNRKGIFMRGKKVSLRKKYYKNFILMIVIPILCVFAIAIGIIDNMIRNAAVSNIRSAQGSMKDMIEGDIRDASLQLSHMVYNDNGNFLWLAGQTDSESVSVRNRMTDRLEKAFRVAASPKQDILSMKLYMKDGRSTYLKDDLRLSSEEVKGSVWYQQALEKNNVVTIGMYDTSAMPLLYTRQRKWEFIIAAALSPDRTLDRSERVEAAVLFYKSDVGNLIKKYEDRATVGITLITDERGNVIYEGRAGEEGSWYLNQMEESAPDVSDRTVRCYGEENRRARYTYVTTYIEDTGWKIINFVPTYRLTQRINKIAACMLVVLVILFALFYLFSRYFLKNILTPVHHLVEGMGEIPKNNFDIRLETEGQYEISQMIDSFNQMVKMLKTSIEEKERAQEKKHEAEIRALQSQINPHFLVNSLNSIRFMAQVSKYEGIQRMAESLIRIVTCSFRSNISFYSLREEIEVLDSYLYLMRIRYSEGFEVEYDVEKECLEFFVPRLILQPLVENAIVHGFTEEEIGHLKISAKRETGHLILRVWDDGCGMPQEQIDRILCGKERERGDNTSIGLENVLTRIRLNFGAECEIMINSECGAYTEIVLMLPVLQEKCERAGTAYEKGFDCR